MQILRKLNNSNTVRSNQNKIQSYIKNSQLDFLQISFYLSIQRRPLQKIQRNVLIENIKRYT